MLKMNQIGFFRFMSLSFLKLGVSVSRLLILTKLNEQSNFKFI